MSFSMRFFIVAAIYASLGMLLGIVMGAREDFSLAPVHAHLNLLGFVLISIYGLVYRAVPEMAAAKLSTIQFYVVNLGVLMTIPALAAFLMGNSSVLPILILGEFLTLAAMLIFLVNLFKHRSL